MPGTTSLKIIFAGSGGFGLPTLRALRNSEHELVAVVTQPDRPAGRGRGLTPTPIGQEASGMAIPLLRTAHINAENLPPADLMIVIAFGQKISAEKVNHPRLGSINLHASRLPRLRGAWPINRAILNGEQVTGNSVIRLADKMDAGAVLAQSQVAIDPLETAGELHDRLSLDGVALVLKVAGQLAGGTAIETPQDDSQATLAPKPSRESAVLDFVRPAEQLARQVRGLYPWPGCRVKLCDAEGSEVGRMKLVRARAVASDEGPRWMPGEITVAGTVQTGEGALEIVEVQPDGRTPMPLADYRRGHHWQPGLRLCAVE